jgi:hypothetical protein|tara:strand:+ start:284 stop:679 length:396 start_codon:yes stop_codon:yes gene_type:complete
MKKIISFLTGDVIKSIGDIFDNLFTNEEEKIKAKNEVIKLLQEKELELQKMQYSIIEAEAKGNWLQRSWRPILMLSFGFIIMYNKFFAPAFNLPNAELEGEFWNLLQLGIGGYVVGRSAEKIAKSVIITKK